MALSLPHGRTSGAMIRSTKKMGIRAVGRDDREMTFLVYALNAVPLVPINSPNTIILNVTANEISQVVGVEYKGEGVKYTTAGGLMNVQNRMDIRSTTANAKIGEIQCEHLYDANEEDPSLQLTWSWSSDKQQVYVNPVDCLNPKTEVCHPSCAQITGDQSMSMLILRFGKDFCSEFKRLLVILGAIKMYFSFFSYQNHPISNYIPSKIKNWPAPTQRALRNLTSVWLRPSTQDIGSRYYIECIDRWTNNLSMVIKLEVVTQKAFFYDIYENMELYSVTLNDTGYVKVYQPSGFRLGTATPSGRFQTYPDPTCSMKIKDVQPEAYLNTAMPVFRVFEVEGDLVAAECYKHADYNLVLVDYLAPLTMRHKALILAKFTFFADKHFKITNRHLLPSLGSFPFVKQ